jgi:hypothetical protein
LDAVRLCVQLLPECLSHTEGPGLRKTWTTSKKWTGVHHHEKLLEIGGYLNKGYHVFVTNYFMSVPLVRHLHEFIIYITGTVSTHRELLPQQFKNKFASGQRIYWRSGPLLAYVFCKEKKNRKKILPFFSPAMPRPKKRKYREDMVAIHK